MAESVGIDPEGFERRLAQYLEWLRVNHFSEATARDRAYSLQHFNAWCVDRGLTRPTEVTKPILECYQAALFHRRKAKNDQPLALITQRGYLTGVKAFFRWLSRSNFILMNPASDLLIPRLTRRLPRDVLTAEEAERVINVPDVSTPRGLRDRAILEVLYSTGMRRMEIVAFSLYDLDRERGTVMVREGKGRRQRVIPIGERAIAWVDKYLADVRPSLVGEPDDGHVFLTHHRGPLVPDYLSEIVGTYVDRAQIGKRGSAHLFRHTMATLMLENGADVRYIQEMLGHAQLGTTQIYTHVSVGKLKEIHAATHPARLTSPRRPKQDA